MSNTDPTKTKLKLPLS